MLAAEYYFPHDLAVAKESSYPNADDTSVCAAFQH